MNWTIRIDWDVFLLGWERYGPGKGIDLYFGPVVVALFPVISEV